MVCCVEFSSYTTVVHNEAVNCSMVVLDWERLACYFVDLCTKNSISGKIHFMNGSGSSNGQDWYRAKGDWSKKTSQNVEDIFFHDHTLLIETDGI